MFWPRAPLVPIGDEEPVVDEVVAVVDGCPILAADHPQRHADPAFFRAVCRAGRTGGQPSAVADQLIGEMLCGPLGRPRRAARLCRLRGNAMFRNPVFTRQAGALRESGAWGRCRALGEHRTSRKCRALGERRALGKFRALRERRALKKC